MWDYGKGVSLRIERIWRHSTLLAVALDLIAAVVAVVSLAVCRAVLRRNDVLGDEVRRTSESRIAELEAFSGRIAHDLRAPLATLELSLMWVVRALPVGNQKLEKA